MRVSVALSGEMRNSVTGLERLREFVIEPLKARGKVDLFIHTRADKYLLSNPVGKGLDARATYLEENRPFDTSTIVSQANPREQGDDPNGQGRRRFLYQSYLQQYWSLAQVGRMVRVAEEREGGYDLIVRARPDCYLKEPLRPETLLDGKVHVPWNDWWPYEVNGKRVETVCDKFAVGPSGWMWRYFLKFYELREFCSSYRIQGEAFTAWSLNRGLWVYDGEPLPWVKDERMEIEQDPKAHENCEEP